MLMSARLQTLIISVEPPSSILATETGLDEILEHRTEDLRYQTIEVLEGPETDRALVRTAISRTARRESSKYQLMLYDRFGRSRRKLVSFSPYYDAPGTSVACMVSIEDSEALLIQEALDACSNAQALLSTEWPFHFQQVNGEFAAMFECSPSDVLGQPVSVVQSHRADSLQWITILQAAVEGQAVHGTYALTSLRKTDFAAALSCFPVVDAPNGPITHVLIRLSPSPPLPPPPHPVPPIPWQSPQHAAARAGLSWDPGPEPDARR